MREARRQTASRHQWVSCAEPRSLARVAGEGGAAAPRPDEEGAGPSAYTAGIAGARRALEGTPGAIRPAPAWLDTQVTPKFVEEGQKLEVRMILDARLPLNFFNKRSVRETFKFYRDAMDNQHMTYSRLTCAPSPAAASCPALPYLAAPQPLHRPGCRVFWSAAPRHATPATDPSLRRELDKDGMSGLLRAAEVVGRESAHPLPFAAAPGPGAPQLAACKRTRDARVDTTRSHPSPPARSLLATVSEFIGDSLGFAGIDGWKSPGGVKDENIVFTVKGATFFVGQFSQQARRPPVPEPPRCEQRGRPRVGVATCAPARPRAHARRMLPTTRISSCACSTR